MPTPATARACPPPPEPALAVPRGASAGSIRPAARRTIKISMTDKMRFTPDHIEVRPGETVKFVVRNAGDVMHEFVIGTRQENDEHAALMVKFPNMEHDEPYMAHVGPGKTGEIVCTFNRPGEFDFACLIAGHYQAGMVGRADARHDHAESARQLRAWHPMRLRA
jgi:uncharacterized cupredoxin-like copper-binding protein